MYFLVYAVEVWKSVHNTILPDALVSSFLGSLFPAYFGSGYIPGGGGGGTLGISGWECAPGTQAIPELVQLNFDALY